MIYFNENSEVISESEIDLDKGYLVDRETIYHQEETHEETKELPGENYLTYTVTDVPAWVEVVSKTYILFYEYNPDNIEQIKTNLISNSKAKLVEYLENNPLLWVDGKHYSVSTEKQSLLTSQLALYSIATAADIPFELTWNTTGEECTVWTYENLCALSLAIGAYVKPFVKKQQEIETAIKNSKTLDEAYAVEIKYE